MVVFLRCIAEAVVEHGLQGLAGMVPGVSFAYDVAKTALDKYRARRADADARAEIQALAQATFDEARRARGRGGSGPRGRGRPRPAGVVPGAGAGVDPRVPEAAGGSVRHHRPADLYVEHPGRRVVSLTAAAAAVRGRVATLSYPQRLADGTASSLQARRNWGWLREAAPLRTPHCLGRVAD